MADEIQQIKDKIDIVDLISEYCQVKPAGANFKCRCPFHNEKTPSFMISRDRQSWHCFGCAKGGDIFSFIEEIEGLEFKEALRYLADKAGVVLTQYRSEVDSSLKNRIKEANLQAARFFHNFLLKMPTAEPARQYLRQRGVSDEMVELWQIGYVPEQWDLLTQYLLKKGIGIDDLVAAGLTIAKEGADKRTARGFYDRFRGRIMFPLGNAQGDIVGFTGRVLVEKEGNQGKYVNTPQTLVYDKSEVIFGLSKAKSEIKSKDLAVMVEGQMDVVACHQAGMKNVVASSGTALTEAQIRLLLRYTHNLAMAFDSDEAGQKAARRGIQVAVQAGMNVRVIKIPEGAGKDPDECLKKNPLVWFKAVEEAQEVMAWLVAKSLQNRDLQSPKDKQKIVNEVLPEIALIPYAVEKDHWLKVLADRLGVEAVILREDLQRLRPHLSQKSGNYQDGEEIKKEPDKATETEVISDIASHVLALLLKFPGLESNLGAVKAREIWALTDYASLYEKLKGEYNAEVVATKPLSPAEKEQLDLLLLKGDLEYASGEEKSAAAELIQLDRRLKEEWKKKRGKQIQQAIDQARDKGDSQELQRLLGEYLQIHN